MHNALRCQLCIMGAALHLAVTATWCLINPQCTCAARVIILGLCVCLSVCLSVCLFPHFLRQCATKQQNSDATQLLVLCQGYTGLILKMAIFVKVLRSKVMMWKPSERANMQVSNGLDSARLRAHFQRQSLKGSWKDYYRLNASWNTTLCKEAYL